MHQKRKYPLKIFLLVFGISLVILLEWILQVGGYGAAFDFVIQSSRRGLNGKLSLNSQYIAIHYFDNLPIQLNRLFRDDPWFEDTEFAKKKPKNTYRIFFLGASTTRGFPFIGRRISYPALFGEILRDVLPERKIEVINTGYDALSSFGVLDIFKKIIEYEPDLLIVYVGHNEFIGHFGTNSRINVGNHRWLIRSMIELQQSSLFLLNKILFLKAKSLFRQGEIEEVNLFKVMLKRSKVTWSQKDHRFAEDQFEKNLLEMARIAKGRRVPIVFSMLVSNLKDFEPVRSEFLPEITNNQRQLILDSIKQGNTAMKAGKVQKSVEYYKKALMIDPQYAETHYRLGSAYVKLGGYGNAQERYHFAREYDKVHLRACFKFNQVIQRVGHDESIPVLDMVKVMEKTSPNGLIGHNFFLEHVHPNINGHVIMASAFAHFLGKRGLVAPTDQWRWSGLRPAADYVKRVGFDRKQYHNARYTVGRLLLDFPFYQCERGTFHLKEVGKQEKEAKIIKNCEQVRRQINQNIFANSN